MQMLMGSDVMVAMSDSMSDTMSVTYSEVSASAGEEAWELYSQEEQFIRVMMATDMVNNIKTTLTDLSEPFDQQWFASILAAEPVTHNGRILHLLNFIVPLQHFPITKSQCLFYISKL